MAVDICTVAEKRVSRFSRYVIRNSIQRLNSRRSKIHNLASGFSEDFPTLRLAHGFLSKNLKLLFTISKRLTKVLDFWFGGFFPSSCKNPYECLNVWIVSRIFLV